MSDKSAFVVDTNFIIQNRELDKALDKIKDRYSVYVTQVSIDERIAQQCRELKDSYAEAEKCKDKFASFASIRFTKSINEVCEERKNALQKRYASFFKQNIIPFEKNGDMLSLVIERANSRKAPFRTAKEASDKGFKDCLLWLTMLQFFKDNGENEVIFVTDDKDAFRNRAEELQKEFLEITGKRISILPNSFYNELVSEKADTERPQQTEADLPNFTLLRNEIEETITSLRVRTLYSGYGDEYWEKTFITSTEFDEEYIKMFFSKLRSYIFEHIFNQSVNATDIINFDGRIEDGNVDILLEDLERVSTLYEKVVKKYPQYIEQFYTAVAKILNQNYRTPAPQFAATTNDELPF